ncbi:uncharacterized protein EAF02_007991 [Botrytis sinoallii]|uniref:uncharacterized protein n=1 Tax=Botrytis sinoallii TaxID=1463999 RepID=UPI001901FEFC|nr:uncharacterized protein EAF02_007991 [Botrytis sinoallii]KAF7879821.1 hypothetical protein EAF02_007991 [Botrytis sinoallii]
MMCCFGMSSGSPALHSRPPVPPRVIAILPPTYRSNWNIASMPVIVEPYIHRTIVPTPHGIHLPHQSSHHPLHHGNPGYQRERSSSLHRGLRIHHAEVSSGLGHGLFRTHH